MFIIDLAVFLMGSVAQCFVGEAWQPFVVRLVGGMAIGADYAIGWRLLAEFSPASVHRRERSSSRRPLTDSAWESRCSSPQLSASSEP